MRRARTSSLSSLKTRLREDAAALHQALPGLHLPTDWPQRFDNHGDIDRWAAALTALPAIEAAQLTVGSSINLSGRATSTEQLQLIGALEALMPWRKGPWRLFDISIATEWRSDWKWQRLRRVLPPVNGARVLDVGCGNGYFGWQLLHAGAAQVLGIDPTLLFCLQHQAINRYARSTRNWVLPLRFEEFPAYAFDLVMSLGVVYHRRDPLAHVAQLFDCTRPGGSVVLETLAVTQGPDLNPAPESRYARMRNVWCVPNLQTLTGWLEACGFEQVEIADRNHTHPFEQHSTGWMRFESLREALDPTDASRTVEGFPAPLRVIALAKRPE